MPRRQITRLFFLLPFIQRVGKPALLSFASELNLIEQWGSGVHRIFKEAEEQKLPTPKIVEIGMRLRFTVPLVERILVDGGGRSPAQSGPESGAQSGAQSVSILVALSDSPLSASEIAFLLGLESKTGAFKRTIKELLGKQLVEYTLSDPPQTRLQKYRLTEKGKRMKDEL